MLVATPDPKISLIGILVELGACLLATALSFALVTIALRYNLIPVVASAAGAYSPHLQKPFDMRTLGQLVDRFRAREEV